MAQYKVPQDVEADDKLLGPFNFRQFIYLLIVAALIALAWALGQIFPLFAILPIPPALFLLVLALPLRKDQPMETYIAALISFYTKPNRRLWNPGQRESTIEITAPKVVEKVLTKDISEEEAGRRLSFLANVVDSEGYSIKDSIAAPTDSPVRDEFIAEAESTPDIFENYQSTQVAADLSSEADRHRAEVVNKCALLSPPIIPSPSKPPPSPNLQLPPSMPPTSAKPLLLKHPRKPPSPLRSLPSRPLPLPPSRLKSSPNLSPSSANLTIIASSSSVKIKISLSLPSPKKPIANPGLIKPMTKKFILVYIKENKA